jgi:hypothetical protein
MEYDDKKEKKNRAVYLPDDFTLNLPEIPLAWLRQYGITDQERQRYKIGWSDENESLVFAAFDCFGNLLLVQFRRFRSGQAGHGNTPNTSKYYTRGFPESIFWTVQVGPDFGGAVCVVEDFVSCLRVGRQHTAMPLWGSNLSLNQIRRLSDQYERLVLWLDFNKAGHAAKLRVKALPYFKSVSTVVTELDPKEQTDECIGKSLGILP